MKRIFGFVGYACNGKSTVLESLADNNNYLYIDIPKIYRELAKLNGYSGVTEWFSSVGLEKYKKESTEAVLKYIESLSDDKDLIIDDIFDIDVYNAIIKKYPNICMIGIHSYFKDRVERLGKRRNETDKEELTYGILARDSMKRYCGIEQVLSKCNSHIENTSTIEDLYNKLQKEINKKFVICILGYSGSGKSTINEMIAKELNIPCILYGKVIKTFINKRGFIKSRHYVQERGIEEYKEYTNELMKEYLSKYLKEHNIVLIDGLVSNDVFKYICSENDVIPILINVDEEVRKQRISKRENLDDDGSKLELHKKDFIKIANGLDMIVSKCDCVVDGTLPIEEVYKEAVKKITYINKWRKENE